MKRFDIEGKFVKKYFFALLLLIYFNLFAFQTGEKLTFVVKYGAISAAKATLEINEITYKDTIPCYQIISTSRTNSFFDKIFKVRDKIESTVDKDKFVSYEFKKNLKEGSYRQLRIHMYYPEQNISFYLKYSRKKKQFKEKRMEIPDNTQDILSALYWVRKQSFSVGDSLFINVTVDGRNAVTKVIVHRIETIKTIFGKKECLVIEPVLHGEAIFKQTGKIKIWLTNDEYKIPVKLKSKIIFGSFKAYLREAENVPYKKIKD